MRLFTGISIAPGVLANIAKMLDTLRPAAPVTLKTAWSPVENLHITTKFIGEWPDARLIPVERAKVQPLADELFFEREPFKQ